MHAYKDDVGRNEIPLYVPGSVAVLRSDYVHLWPQHVRIVRYLSYTLNANNYSRVNEILIGDWQLAKRYFSKNHELCIIDGYCYWLVRVMVQI
jgi:hypothetical protein